MPSEQTQRAIVGLLDQKGASIAKLIATKLRLLELLNEKRRALVSEAVSVEATKKGWQSSLTI